MKKFIPENIVLLFSSIFNFFKQPKNCLIWFFFLPVTYLFFFIQIFIGFFFFIYFLLLFFLKYINVKFFNFLFISSILNHDLKKIKLNNYIFIFLYTFLIDIPSKWAYIYMYTFTFIFKNKIFRNKFNMVYFLKFLWVLFWKFFIYIITSFTFIILKLTTEISQKFAFFFFNNWETKSILFSNFFFDLLLFYNSDVNNTIKPLIIIFEKNQIIHNPKDFKPVKNFIKDSP